MGLEQPVVQRESRKPGPSAARLGSKARSAAMRGRVPFVNGKRDPAAPAGATAMARGSPAQRWPAVTTRPCFTQAVRRRRRPRSLPAHRSSVPPPPTTSRAPLLPMRGSNIGRASPPRPVRAPRATAMRSRLPLSHPVASIEGQTAYVVANTGRRAGGCSGAVGRPSSIVIASVCSRPCSLGAACPSRRASSRSSFASLPVERRGRRAARSSRGRPDRSRTRA